MVVVVEVDGNVGILDGSTMSTGAAELAAGSITTGSRAGVTVAARTSAAAGTVLASGLIAGGGLGSGSGSFGAGGRGPSGFRLAGVSSGSGRSDPRGSLFNGGRCNCTGDPDEMVWLALTADDGS